MIRTEQLVVISLLGISAVAMLYICWVIIFRLRDHLLTKAYKAILLAKALWAFLCLGGIYLIIFPPGRTWALTIQITWFTVFALACILSALGFYMYSQDVRYILKRAFGKRLPVKVPDSKSPADSIHVTQPPA